MWVPDVADGQRTCHGGAQAKGVAQHLPVQLNAKVAPDAQRQILDTLRAEAAEGEGREGAVGVGGG